MERKEAERIVSQEAKTDKTREQAQADEMQEQGAQARQDASTTASGGREKMIEHSWKWVRPMRGAAGGEGRDPGGEGAAARVARGRAGGGGGGGQQRSDRGDHNGLWVYRDSDQMVEGRNIAAQGESSHDSDFEQALIAQRQKQAR